MERKGMPLRVVLGVSGATGTVYGVRLLERLRATPVETHLIFSTAAKRVAVVETDYRIEEIEALADFVYDNDDIGAPPASGSFQTDGMIVAPCSIKSLSAIANSYGDTLLVRAADVTLKEGRRLVLVLRETPLHLGHLRLAAQAAEIGATILPPIPSFYHRPKTLGDLIDQTVARILDQFGLGDDIQHRWKGSKGSVDQYRHR
jgi:4-hydroxy-3-polyprenylbenzoate decarboxylase